MDAEEVQQGQKVTVKSKQKPRDTVFNKLSLGHDSTIYGTCDHKCLTF